MKTHHEHRPSDAALMARFVAIGERRTFEEIERGLALSTCVFYGMRLDVENRRWLEDTVRWYELNQEKTS